MKGKGIWQTRQGRFSNLPNTYPSIRIHPEGQRAISKERTVGKRMSLAAMRIIPHVERCLILYDVCILLICLFISLHVSYKEDFFGYHHPVDEERFRKVNLFPREILLSDLGLRSSSLGPLLQLWGQVCLSLCLGW